MYVSRRPAPDERTRLAPAGSYRFRIVEDGQVRKTLVFLVVLSLATTGFAAISYDDGTKTLTYGAPGDLDSVVDPQGVLADTQESFGMTLADYNALTPQVVGFNASTAGSGGDGHPSTLIAYYTASETATFAFAAEYNYGGYTSMSRTAFSGTQAYHMLGTVEVDSGGVLPDNTWFMSDIAVREDGKGVTALGLCAHGRTGDLISGPGQMILTMHDNTEVAVDYPAFGGSENLQQIFVGYQDLTGTGIKKVRFTRPGAGNSFIAVDDLAFLIGDALRDGDATRNGCVDGLDYVVWSNNYETGSTWDEGDLTGDQIVDGLDYVVWSNNYQAGCPGTPGAVPEPASVAVLLAGWLVLLRRKRREE